MDGHCNALGCLGLPGQLRMKVCLHLRYRLLQEYAARQEAEGALTPEELPPEVLSAVERNITADARHFASFAAAVASAPEQVPLALCTKD